MGGDFGPRATVSALIDSLIAHRHISALVFGDRSEISEQLNACRDLEVLQRIEIRHSDSVVTGTDLPSAVLRNKRTSSMGAAMQAVAEGEAAAFISAGNTGAIMALGLYFVKPLPGVSRPAICTAVPTLTGRSYVLDLGANIHCSAHQLYQFGLLGSLMAQHLGRIAAPSVRLLNVGEELSKGSEKIQQAAELLADEPLVNYCGYIEGDGIFAGATDVVVCDGFAGNVALKTSEGLVAMVSALFRQSVNKHWLPKLAALLMRPTLMRLKAQLDPAIYNGAHFLGLSAVVIKSHGKANKTAFTNAINVAIDAADHNLPLILSPILKQRMEPQQGI